MILEYVDEISTLNTRKDVQKINTTNTSQSDRTKGLRYT